MSIGCLSTNQDLATVCSCVHLLQSANDQLVGCAIPYRCSTDVELVSAINNDVVVNTDGIVTGYLSCGFSMNPVNLDKREGGMKIDNYIGSIRVTVLARN